ncbi:hypothetical protein M2140_001713 [Clostridiales Family XIII bacterium PM5-7]
MKKAGFKVASGDDGFHADEKLNITSGEIDITESYEGLEGLEIEVAGGNIKIIASDDGINAAGGNDASGFGGNHGADQFGGGTGSSDGSIVISGGTIFINASGDGIDANGTLLISGGTTTVCGPTQGDTSVLDYDVSATITGGTFIGTGASQMAQTFSDSEQGVIAVTVQNQEAGATITVKNEAGDTIVTCEPELSFGLVIISSPEITKGETYTLTIGSSSSQVTAK